MKNLDKDKILEETIGFIEKFPDNISATRAWKYVRTQGVRIGFENYNKIFQRLVSFGYLKARGYNKGYALLKPVEVLKDDFANNIVTESTVRVTKKSVTIRTINKICEWVRSIEQTKKKNIF
jgi:hypothetical protein